jgi:hypothetical protein
MYDVSDDYATYVIHPFFPLKSLNPNSKKKDVRRPSRHTSFFPLKSLNPNSKEKNTEGSKFHTKQD